MLWQVDAARPGALHEQIAGNVRRALTEGSLVPGERLPPAGELGAALDVHANTVLQAYRVLRDEGLLEFRRGRGVRASSGSVPRASVVDAAHRLVEQGRRHGFSAADLVRLVIDVSGERATVPEAGA